MEKRKQLFQNNQGETQASGDGLDTASSRDIQSDDNHVGNLQWTDAMDCCLGKSLVEKMKEGYNIHSILQRQEYESALPTLNEKTGFELALHHIRDRLKTWKKQYGTLKQLLSHPDFKWDKTRKMMVADDSAWTNYIKAHLDAKAFRGRVIENYDNLCTIFGNDSETAEVEISPVQNSCKVQDQAKNTRWTYEMDRCLIEQLVEQMTLGNKNQKGFKLVALKAVVCVINNMFSLGLTIENIRNRLKTLKKQYILVKELLSQNGFKWDERQKMVIANDLEWRECIKRNPDVSRIRGRTIHNFNELHVIVGNEQAGRRMLGAGDRVVNNIQNNEESIEAPVDVMVDEDKCHNNTNDDIQVSSQPTISRPSPSRTKESPKRKRTSDVMLEIMGGMAENIGRIADALTASKAVSLDELFQMVQSIPEFDDDLIIDACEYLSFDENRAKMFMNLDERLRKKWLLKRLRG